MIECEINLGLWGPAKDLQRALDQTSSSSEAFNLHAAWIEAAAEILEEVAKSVEAGDVILTGYGRDKIEVKVYPQKLDRWAERNWFQIKDNKKSGVQK